MNSYPVLVSIILIALPIQINIFLTEKLYLIKNCHLGTLRAFQKVIFSLHSD